MSDPVSSIDNLGNLHDAWLIEFCWNDFRQNVKIALENYRASVAENNETSINDNLMFDQVVTLNGSLDNKDMMISELNIEKRNDAYEAHLILKSGSEPTWTFHGLTITET